MPLIAADHVVRLSGGAGNAVGNASLGGAKSSTAAGTGLEALFDAVASAEASAGDTEYRCVYLHNANVSSQMEPAIVWVSANTPNANTVIEIGLGTSAVNGTEQTIANENTAPSGVSFSAAANEGAAVNLGNIPAGQHRALWIRRTVTAGAPALASDTWQLTFKSDFSA
jgi:hypothetical protein